ncbi:MAG: MFS transporter [Candidatus Methanomethylicaceae archaeon]|jgi:MFS family permease
MSSIDIDKEKTFSNALKIAVSSCFGFSFQVFDFTAYIFASTLFAKFFFPSSNPETSLLLSFATVSLTFVSRPIGGIFFGHFGDRIGRKGVWFLALIGIGLVTILMGFLPTYQQVGVIATVALITLRLLQGFFISGEQAGGWILTEENSPSKWRGLFGSVVGIGAGLSQVLLSIAIFLASALAPGSQFALIGWRIIFWFGAIPFFITLIIRWKVSESVEWKTKAAPKVEKIPLLTALRNKSNTKFFLIMIVAWFAVNFFTFGSITFLPSFLKLYTPNSPNAIATIVLIASLGVMVGAPIWGYLSDKWKSRRTFLTLAFLTNAILLYPLIFIFNLGMVGISLLAGIALGFFSPMMMSVLPAWITENTKTSVRYSTFAAANGIGAALGGLAPYTVVLFSATVGPVTSTAMVAISGCLVGLLVIPFSPRDRAKQELE